MASYTSTLGDTGVHNKTLVASTVDTVTLTGLVAADQELEIVLLDTNGDVYYTTNGATPTVAGANTYVLPAGAVARTRIQKPGATGAVIKLISSGTPKYSVQRAQ